MKKLFIILISALTSTLYFGQDATPQQTPPPTQFTITKAEGLSPFIVVKTEGKTKEELYKKTIEWINKSYNKPSEVIKAQVENDYIPLKTKKTSKRSLKIPFRSLELANLQFQILLFPIIS